MKLLNGVVFKSFLVIVGFSVLLQLAGCDENGNVTEIFDPGGSDDTFSDRSVSGVAGPPIESELAPVERIARDQYGRDNTVAALSFNLSGSETSAFSRGLNFFITEHTAGEGLGPVANQTRCLGCHMSSSEAVADVPVQTDTPFSRAARSGPTDFEIVGGTVADGGMAPDAGSDHAAMFGTTATFTIFGDIDPGTGAFIGLSEFGGAVQHLRPSIAACKADFIPPTSIDPHLQGDIRRTLGERGAPPYIGRGLMEAIYFEDIVALEDPDDSTTNSSSLPTPDDTGCTGDCISGRHNENTSNQAFIGGDPVVRVARFGLRAAGPTVLQFVIGGSNGELGFTSPFRPTEPGNPVNGTNSACVDPAGEPELEEGDIFNIRSLIRLLGIPEHDACLLGTSDVCEFGATRASVENGARLFGVDINAYRSRLIAGMTPTGDANAINQIDRQLDCVGCHIPIVRTGQSPAEVGARHLSNRWVPLFSDLLIHDMGEVTPERQAPSVRMPVEINGTFDIIRNLADDALPNQGLASGREWRTPPLMGIGLMGPPFLHDSRVYLSTQSVLPAGTVYSNATDGTNARLVIQTFDDALRAAIEMHDLPPPDDATTPAGGGCPVPPGNSGGIVYPNGAGDICPPLDDDNRSEARGVMQRWRGLTEAEQQDVINFLKSL